MYIKDEEINRIFNKKNWNYANHHSGQNTIKELNIDFDKERKTYEITARVDIYGYSNENYFALSVDGEISNFGCDCVYCRENILACGHIGIVLLEIYEMDQIDFPYHYEYEDVRIKERQQWVERSMMHRSREFIKRYESSLRGEFQAHLRIHKIHLYATLSNRYGTINVTYKIGSEKTYVIKNIISFLQSIDAKEDVTYGKNLAFSHHLDAFDDDAKAQIQFLQEYRNTHRNEMEYGYGERRTVKIDRSCVDTFFDIYAQISSEFINCEFTTDEEELLALVVEEHEPFYQIRLKKSSEKLLSGMNYWYYIEAEELHRYRFDITRHCHELLSELQAERQLMIHRNDMFDFCKYVYPSLREYVSLQGVSLEGFLPSAVFLQSYVDVEENGDISVKILCHYEHQQTMYVIDKNMEPSIENEHILTFIKQYASVLDYDAHIAYINEHDNLAYHFLKDGLGILDKLSEVFISDRIKQMNSPKKIAIQVGIHMENNLLEIDVRSVDIPKEELYAVLKAYRKKKTYHRLKNGELIYLQSDEMAEMDQVLQDLHIQPSDISKDRISVPSFHAFELEGKCNTSANLQFERSQQFQSMIEDVTQCEKHHYVIPQDFQSVLRDYQKYGFQWLKTMSAYGFGGILADDMGLGKTIQIISLLEDANKEQLSDISLVIAPASLILNWQDEMQKFSKTLNCLCIHGTSALRKQQIQQLTNYDVIVTSYDYIRRDYVDYRNFKFRYLILDEAQYIKNHNTKNAFAVKQLQAVQRFALSGTPIENSLAELWSIFDFLMPNYLYNYHYFRAHFEKEIVKNNNEKAQQRLKQLVEPFILRRVKQDVLKELPEKSEHVYYMEFSEEEKKIYYANLVQINTQLQKKLQMEEFDHFMILAMMTKLRQICCDARLLYENITTLSSKMQGCMDIVLSAKNNGKKVLLFSSFTSVLELLEIEFAKENIAYLKLTGETKKDKRHAYVDEFQTGEVDVFLISLKAGGTGLNLTAAEVVIHFDPWWNMSAQNQATDRAHRIGQMKNIQVYKLIIRDTIEERILKLQARKMNLSDTFIHGKDGSISNMSKDEILDLFT